MSTLPIRKQKLIEHRLFYIYLVELTYCTIILSYLTETGMKQE